MQKIWIVKTPKNNTLHTKELLLKKLPKSLWIKANRYINIESSLNYIVGRLLLKKALITNKLPISLLEEIHYSEHGKPSFLNHNFSISHSNGYVSLVFGTKYSIGIDIEKKKVIDLALFHYLFTKDEWVSIKEDQNSLERFYWFWVRKEALLKASGSSIKQLKQLIVQEHQGMYKEKKYHFTPFKFDSDYNGIVATEEIIDFEVEVIKIEDL